MRLVRIGLLTLAAALTGLSALIVLGLQPALQTWAVQRYLARHSRWHASVGHVAAGFSWVEIRGLQIERRDCVLAAPVVELDLPALAVLLGRPVSIHRLVADHWTLDFTAHATAWAAAPRPAPVRSGLVPAAEAAPAERPLAAARVFRGLFATLILPYRARLENLEAEGDIVLPPPASPAGQPLRAHARVSGSGLTPGHEGRLNFALDQRFAAGTAPVDSVGVTGVAYVSLGEDGAVSRLTLRMNASARGEKLPEEVRLAADFGAARGAFGENYTLALVRDGKTLASLSADYASNAPRLRGAWKVDLADRDVSPFALGRSLPVFSLVGEGRFDTDDTLEPAHVSGELNGMADRLGTLWPKLENFGAARFQAAFDLTQGRGLLRVDHLEGSLAGAKPILSVRALQAFAFNFRSGELQVADPARELLRLSLQGVPVAWVEPFLPPWRLAGEPIVGEILANAREGGLTVHTVAPLTTTVATADRGGRILLRNVDLSLSASAAYTPQGWQADLSGRAAEGQRPLLKLSARLGQLAGAHQPVKIAGKFASHLPAWTAQPALRAPTDRTLAGGELAGDFTASLDRERSFQARLAVGELAVRSGADVELYPRITAEIRADLGRDGKITFTLPIILEREGRKSDLTLDGAMVWTRRGLAFDARAASARLVWGDTRILGAGWLLAGKLLGPGPRGRLNMDLKRVEDGTWGPGSLKGTLYAVPGALEFDGLNATLADGGRITANGSFGWGGDRPEPYRLQADVALDKFEAAPVFRMLNPERPPILEGRCSLTARLDGRGASPREALARAHGDFTLNSGQGVVRALRAEVEEDIKQAPSRLAEAVDEVTSLFGKSTAAKSFLDKQGQLVVQITDAFKEIHYDQLRVTANRDSGLNVHLSQFALISPEIRLYGSGQISHLDATSFGNQPLELDLAVGARGHLAGLMNGVGLLNGHQDNLGYIGLVSPVYLGGTLDDIDQTQWKDLLIKAAMRKAARSLLDKLLGK